MRVAAGHREMVSMQAVTSLAEYTYHKDQPLRRDWVKTELLYQRTARLGGGEKVWPVIWSLGLQRIVGTHMCDCVSGTDKDRI